MAASTSDRPRAMPPCRSPGGRLLAGLLITILSLAGCAAAPPAAPESSPSAAFDPAAPLRWKALLVAGDRQEAAFDNAPRALRSLLLAAGVKETDIALVSAHDTDPARDARYNNIWRAAADLKVGPGDACLVFVTAHGLNTGLVINTAPQPWLFSPMLLNNLLSSHCRQAPTVVITSGCYSGVFAETPMLAPNRIIFTAARRDRTSFGCNAGLEFTFFDHCLLDNLPRSADWAALAGRLRSCVSQRETQRKLTPASEPRFAMGEAVRALPILPVPPAALASLWHMVPADLAQAKAIPFGGAQGQRGLENYRQAAAPKALAVSPSGGGWAWRGGPRATAEALDTCARAAGGSGCLLFAVDDRVVWHDSLRQGAAAE
jgi:hypothetical protein